MEERLWNFGKKEIRTRFETMAWRASTEILAGRSDGDKEERKTRDKKETWRVKKLQELVTLLEI